MANCAIRDYENLCCGGNRPSFPTGIVQNAYTRRVDGTFKRVDGVDLTSGYSGNLLLKPNGNTAASRIFDSNEPALCCG